MKALASQQVDVFTAVPFKGNPVAVILDGAAMSSEQMQSIAAWTNLSETTIVCAPTDQEADYRLRIFTPRRELPFAGHPTIGSAHAVLCRGFNPRTDDRLVQECGKGLVDIKIDGERLLLGVEAEDIDPGDADRVQRRALAHVRRKGSHDVAARELKGKPDGSDIDDRCALHVVRTDTQTIRGRGEMGLGRFTELRLGKGRGCRR